MYIVQINDLPGGTNFDPRAIIWTILLEVHYTMFHAKYLTSGLCQFREDDFLSFYYIHIRKTYDPQGMAKFDNRGNIWTTLVEYL
jgi:hypothetical protein